MPLRVIPDRSERPEHLVQSSRAKGADVFDEGELRPDFVDEPVVLKPKARSLSAQTGLFAGGADVLAREAAADDVDRFDAGELKSISAEVSHVGELIDVGPVLSQDPASCLIELAERNGAEVSGALKPETEAADSAEKVEDSKGVGVVFMVHLLYFVLTLF